MKKRAEEIVGSLRLIICSTSVLTENVRFTKRLYKHTPVGIF